MPTTDPDRVQPVVRPPVRSRVRPRMGNHEEDIRDGVERGVDGVGTDGERTTTDGVDNAALVARVHDDPAAGWAEAWDRFGHPLHSFCVRMLDDRAEADDAVADVFLVAAERIDQLRDPDAFGAWLTPSPGVASNVAGATARARPRSIPTGTRS